MHNDGGGPAEVQTNSGHAHEDAGQEQVEVPIEESEEGRAPKTRRAPDEPTNEEIRLHRITHTPFRSWCPECVKARAKAYPHFSVKKDEQRTIPTFHLDYWFMRDRRGAELVPVATMRDDLSKAFKAHVVSGKGDVAGVAKQLARDIERLGYDGDIALKCDQEAALMDLVKALVKERVGKKTLVETAKAKDSASNGVAERAVQSVEGMVRTFKFALEKKLGVQISSTHPIMTWIVEHSAETLNRYHISLDGRTAYERVRGKAYKGEMIEFGRRVFHKLPGKPEGGSMEKRWIEGIWLGKTPRSDEHIISLESGRIVKARDVVLRLESESWDADKALGVKVVPDGLNEPRDIIHRAGHAREVDGSNVGPVQEVHRNVVREDDERDGPVIADPEMKERAPLDIYSP